jgi:predicted nucleic acid-binding protein
MFLVDSSVWIAFFNGANLPQVDRLAGLARQNQILVGDLILLEVLQGFRSERDFQVARRLLLNRRVVSLVNRSIALRSAENYRALRQRGLTVRKTIDCLIATWCIEHGVPLLYTDRDFEPFVKHLGLQAL